MTDKTATTSRPINTLLATRWSPRAFDPDQAVEPDALTALFEAARWASSCYNEQPWRYLVWDRNTDAVGWQRACDVLTPRNQLWAAQAPVLALVLSKTSFSHNGQTNRWAEYDAGQATEAYPFNPNGSPLGLAGLCSADGRHLAMMPHPERAYLPWQCHWLPQQLKRLQVSPWLRMFQNAYQWCQGSK